MSEPKHTRRALTRRGFLRTGLYSGAAAMLPWRRGRAALIGDPSYGPAVFAADFAQQGWSPFSVEGIALREVDDTSGVLVATSDVYPSDGRAIAFVRDRRLRDASIRAQMQETGREAGLVLRRVGRRRYYAALYQHPTGNLSIVERSPEQDRVLASASLPAVTAPFELEFSAQTLDGNPLAGTELCARVTGAGQIPLVLSVLDSTPDLQQPGDPGVLSTADGNVPPEFATAPPGVGDFRAFYGTAQGEQFLATPAGQALKDLHRQLGTAVFDSVEVLPMLDGQAVPEAPGVTLPSSMAATAIALDEDLIADTPPGDWPSPHDPGAGARLGVVADVPARVRLEYACSPTPLDDAAAESLLDQTALSTASADTNAYTTVFHDLAHLERGKWVYWRPVLQRFDEDTLQTVGPEVLDPYQRIQGFRTLPDGASGEACFAIASCATQFGAPDGPPGTLALIAQEEPHVFHWAGDLHYPDSQGLNSQNFEGYEGIWKQYLGTPELRSLLDRMIFAPVRDDHDYGGNDVAREKILTQLPHGAEPFEEILGARFGSVPGTGEPRLYYRFSAPRMVELIVLEQRRYKDTPESIADVPFVPGQLPAKTLIGAEQREWLLERLRDAEPSFKIVCTPCPLNHPVNNENHWGTEGADGFTGERDWILDQIDQISQAENPGVRDRIVWVSGDSHSGMVVRRDHFLELRPTPLNIAGEGGAPLALPDPETLPATNDEILFSQNGNFFVRIKARVEPGATLQQDEVVMEVAMLQETGLFAFGPEEFRRVVPGASLPVPEPSRALGLGVGVAALAALGALRRRGEASESE